jgi:hypothetical protein
MAQILRSKCNLLVYPGKYPKKTSVWEVIRVGKSIVDLNADQMDGSRRIFAHASNDERTVLSAAIHGVMRRPFS